MYLHESWFFAKILLVALVIFFVIGIILHVGCREPLNHADKMDPDDSLPKFMGNCAGVILFILIGAAIVYFTGFYLMKALKLI